MRDQKSEITELANEAIKEVVKKRGGLANLQHTKPEVNTQLPETGFIRLPKVLSLIPISKSSLYAGIQKKKYPAPVKLSERCSAWRVEDIRQLIEDLAA